MMSGMWGKQSKTQVVQYLKDLKGVLKNKGISDSFTFAWKNPKSKKIKSGASGWLKGAFSGLVLLVASNDSVATTGSSNVDVYQQAKIENTQTHTMDDNQSQPEEVIKDFFAVINEKISNGNFEDAANEVGELQRYIYGLPKNLVDNLENKEALMYQMGVLNRISNSLVLIEKHVVSEEWNKASDLLITAMNYVSSLSSTYRDYLSDLGVILKYIDYDIAVFQNILERNITLIKDCELNHRYDEALNLISDTRELINSKSQSTIDALRSAGFLNTLKDIENNIAEEISSSDD